MKMTKTCLAILLLFPLATWADRINEAEALQKAQAFLQERGRSEVEPTSMRTATKGRKAPAANTTESDYYVFNIGSNDGFVIVSGDDRVDAILGYADSGSLNEDAMPDGLRYLLDGYAEQMAWLDEHGVSEPTGTSGPYKAQRAIRTAIAPLIKTHWDQGAPYNNLCPELVSTNDKGETVTTKTVTGCVATAMAQIMYYHKYPAASPVIPGYSTRNGKFTNLPSLPETTFSWNDMLLEYGGSATDTQKTAVATLMKYCGWALQMNYNTSSSAYSESIAEALRTIFGYSDDIDYAFRRSYSYTDWINLLYNELAAGRPVALGGQSMGGGHSFVCDGYQGDDYFHINWGWGGSSDGYFRLTSLNPEEQGLGGSSTLDGFSYGQDAIIGIRPPQSSETPTKATRLVLGALQFGASDATVIKTFTRSTTSDNFANIPLCFQLGCFLPGKNTFEVAAQVVNSHTNAVEQTVSLSSDNLAFIYTYTYNKTAAFGANLGDGAYRINLVSRVADTDDWQPCYGAITYYLDAVIANNTLTLKVPFLATGITPTLVSGGITVDNGSPTTLGEEVRLKASITGGSSDYHGILILKVNDKEVMGKQADIPANETVSVSFAYTPSTAGANTVAVWAYDTEISNGTELGDASINITDNGSTMALTLGLSADISNTYTKDETTYLYGNGIRATITVTNEDKTYDYKGTVNCSVRTWDGDSYIGNATSYAVTVPKNGSTSIPIVVDGLEAGKVYSLRITYYTVKDSKKKLADNEFQTPKYTMGNGYLVGNADGSTTLCQAANTISGLGKARYVDLTGISNPANISVTPSTNPNCLYLLAKGASVPNGLEGKNVVIDGAAESITLKDGNDFYSPIDFTAASISYERTFTLAAAGSSGWNTICLPFTVNTITCNNKTVDWFHSANDTGKNFWLRAFTSDDNGTVAFDYTNNMVANTPYIIAVPDSNWGTEYQMTDRPVTFSGSNAHIAATKTASVSGNNYKFCGSSATTSLTDGYVLNGSNFVKLNSTRSVPPFRAWFEAVNISSLSRTSLVIVNSEETGISTMELANSNDIWYTLSGLRLDTKPTVKGIYIHNGKKEMIK